MRVGTMQTGEAVEVIECVDGLAKSIAVGGVLCSYQFYGPTVMTVAERVVSRGVGVLEVWERVGRATVKAIAGLKMGGGWVADE